jgi:hypothetical protein
MEDTVHCAGVRNMMRAGVSPLTKSTRKESGKHCVYWGEQLLTECPRTQLRAVRPLGLNCSAVSKNANGQQRQTKDGHTEP